MPGKIWYFYCTANDFGCNSMAQSIKVPESSHLTHFSSLLPVQLHLPRKYLWLLHPVIIHRIPFPGSFSNFCCSSHSILICLQQWKTGYTLEIQKQSYREHLPSLPKKHGPQVACRCLKL